MLKSCEVVKILVILQRFRGVAQPGLEYASGGRVVASSNLVTPTETEEGVSKLKILAHPLKVYKNA